MNVKIILVFICFTLLWSCQRKTEVPAEPVISFQNNVQPVIIGNCTESNCHGKESGQEALITYDDIINNADVVPGEARGSDLYHVITGKWGGLMPPSPKSPLTDVQITTIYLWIMQGAKNN